MNLKSRIKKIDKKISKAHIKTVCILFGNETQKKCKKRMNLKDDTGIVFIRVRGV